MRFRRATALLLSAALLGGLTACTGTQGGGENTADAGKIALLLPDAKTARYETFDRPLFEARVAELGPYEVLYSNADGDATKQQQQRWSCSRAGGSST